MGTRAKGARQTDGEEGREKKKKKKSHQPKRGGSQGSQTRRARCWRQYHKNMRRYGLFSQVPGVSMLVLHRFAAPSTLDSRRRCVGVNCWETVERDWF